MTDTAPALDPSERLVDGPSIDSDLGVTSRCRRRMVADGRLPAPVGYLAGRAVWKLGDYLAARQRLIGAGRAHRPGTPVPEAT